ncbi:MAG: ERF family protein [Clostridiales bacterium]|nr:ERF family protein [Clostridiales bacterium]
MAETNIYLKLMAIQKELKAPKNLKNSFGNYYYRNAESILEALKPLEVKYKVITVLSDEIVEIGGRVYVKTIASLIDAENDNELIKVTAYAREAETKKGMDDAQVTGAASSYARKYALNGLFLLDDTKDADTDEYTAQNNAVETPERSARVNTKTKPRNTAQAKTDGNNAPADKNDTARAELRELIAEYRLTTEDVNGVLSYCVINASSTHEDYVRAVEYVKRKFGGGK